jgi:hypothetical protein
VSTLARSALCFGVSQLARPCERVLDNTSAER